MRAERERVENLWVDIEQEAVEYFRAGAEPGSLHERYADAIEKRGDEYWTLQCAFYKVQDRAEAAEHRVANLAEHLVYLLEHGHLDETGKRHVAEVLVRHAVDLRLQRSRSEGVTDAVATPKDSGGGR